MKQIFKIIFPYKLYLHIFQLERYDINRSLFWIFSHFWKRTTQNKKPLIYTKKAKAILFASILFLILFFLLGIVFYNLSFSFILLFILLFQPYIIIIFSIYLFKPYEFYVKIKAIKKTKTKIKSLKNVKVIGIAGSYGKTSVKNILHHLLSSKYKVLKTPLSYNTILGISQVVDLELDESYDFFICEFGEFKKGDIIEMCKMVDPLYGVMTGINSQHLERFKNIENTTDSIFELFDYLKNKKQRTVINFANEYLKKESEKNKSSGDIISYGDYVSGIIAGNIKFSDDGTSFDLSFENIKKEVKTPLLGNAHINNILGACTMAYELGVSFEEIAEKLKTLPKVSHRFEQQVLGNGYLLIDNSYSSNEDSFNEALFLLEKINRKNKILITPGMVEIGKDSKSVHLKFGGQIEEVCSKVILVGNTIRTRSLADGINDDKVVFMDNIKDMWSVINSFNFNPKDSVIILENDLPDNY
ncbi:MAG: UDP-N-acetylmuramoyl-tripeptide--D-alanyl-D-alanine ligase [Candidatus Paceibacterota bacterium]